jgi:ATP/maltotriose-dependent transcriptional regulator MalT
LDSSLEVAYADYIRGVGALYANDLPVAVETLHRSLTVLSGTPTSDPHLYLIVLSTFSHAAGLAGDHERALPAQREMLATAESRGAVLHQSIAQWTGGLIAWTRGDFDHATAQVVEALRLKELWASHDRYTTAQCIELLAWITTGQGRHGRAATLLGAADMIWTDSGTSIAFYLHLVGHHDACERLVRDALGEVAFTDAFHHGRTLSYADILAFAFEQPRQPAPAPPEHLSNPLTRREQEIAELVGRGLSNKEIANRLVISQRTAESHVENILTKLGFARRAQVAAWITAQRSGSHQAAPL